MNKVHRLSRKGVHIINMETRETMNFKQVRHKRIINKVTLKSNGYTRKDSNRICVYFHYYDNNTIPFYIGQGTLDRAFRFGKYHRNDKWFHVVKDTNLVKVVIKHIDISIEKSIRLEKEYINQYNPIANISKGVGATNINKYENKLCKSVVKLDLNGDYINDYISIKEAAKTVNGCASTITKCCKGKLNQYKGFKWVYFKDYYSDINPNHS